MDNNFTITVEKNEYDDLIRGVQSLYIILEALFKETRLSYNGDKLRFESEENFFAVVRAAFPERYADCLKQLQAAKTEAEDESD